MVSLRSAATLLAVAARSWAQNDNGGYWFDNAVDILATMQKAFFNGTYWPGDLQWAGAVLGTYLSASNELFTNGLGQYNGNVPNANTSYAAIQANIQDYFSQLEAYYGGEDTIQIFGAAFDDAQWVVLEWLEAIKFVNLYDDYAKSDLGQDQIANFSHRAHIFYNIVQGQFDTSLCNGGLTWNPALQPYKNAITNELFISSSIGMYLYYPGDSNSDPYPSPSYTAETGKTLSPLPSLAAHDPLLLQNAVNEYNWFRSQTFENDQGLIVDGFHISSGQTTCDQIDTMVYSYNQGVLLSGLRGLWEATGNTSYLQDGYDYIATTVNATGYQDNGSTINPNWSGLGRNGIMEDYCDADGNCSQDSLSFKGIYFHHLDLFCEPLPTETPLISGLTSVAPASLATAHTQHCASYAAWVELNAQAALNTRNSSSGIIGQWWGAPATGQPGQVKSAVPRPAGSIDIINEPWLLDTPEWECPTSEPLCGVQAGSEQHDGRVTSRKSARQRTQRRQATSQVTSVETQGQGLAVVLAAANFNLEQPAM